MHAYLDAATQDRIIEAICRILARYASGDGFFRYLREFERSELPQVGRNE